ncbi:hypothetical protein Acr_12g0002500 [Actinidia rufa]|uniref:Uncharacterized protein n=1 Tax=Actinidia rufa TaxID=165716 RepID=A0A7J0FHR4_9ERIC|nr:hypothetical protein Acr_12g0002500 [Actinidia rufa]
MALAQTTIVFGNNYFELRHGGSPSLLYSDSLAETSALLGACLDWLGACSDAPIAVLVKLVSPCKLPLVPKHAFGSPPIIAPCPNFDMVTLPSLLNSDNSGVMVDLARVMLVLGGVSIKLRCKGPPNLFHRDNSVVVPALARPKSIVVFGNWEFRAGDDDLYSFPRHNGSLPDNKASRIRLFALRIKERAPQRGDFNLEGFSAKLNENLPLALIISWEEVILETEPKVLGAEPISISISDNEHSDVLTYNLLQFKEDFSITKLDKQVTVADFAKDYDTSLALKQVVMLSKDFADLVEEGSEDIRDLLVMQQVQRGTTISERMKVQSSEIKKSKKKISSLEKQSKLDSKTAYKASLELVAVIQKRDASLAAITKAWGEVEAIQEVWLACLKELGIPSDHPAWSTAPPEVELVDSP